MVSNVILISGYAPGTIMKYNKKNHYNKVHGMMLVTGA